MVEERHAAEALEVTKRPTENKSPNISRLFVIPSKAGIQGPSTEAVAPCSSQGQALDPRFRGGDDN